MEPAPYTGLLVQTVAEENDRAEILKKQSVEVTVNGQPEVVRAEAIHLRGVDSLSTENITAYIDYYVNYTHETAPSATDEATDVSVEHKVESTPLPVPEQIKFRVQWVNDSSVNLVFKDHDEAKKVLDAISITDRNPMTEGSDKILVDFENEAYVADIIQERETKPYNPVIEFQKRISLSSRLGIADNKPEESNDMDEDESSVVMYARQAFHSDRKVKNASAYSRYYLLHGEPERKPFRKHNPRKRRDNDNDDLFANKVRARGRRREDEEDLFAHKLKNRDRSRSPTRMEDDN